MRRIVVSLVFLFLLPFGGCRCAQTPAPRGDREDRGEDQAREERQRRDDHGGSRIEGSEESVVSSRREEEPAAPPERPGERRRPRGAPPHPEPTSADPEDGDFTLEEATAGLEGEGPLFASIDTDFGEIRCRLYADQVPNTVANFVGLARGVRPWWDPYEGEWVRRPFYNGLTFHRVIPDFMIQGGCPLGNGSGNPGYRFDDEFVDDLVHDRAGILSMANAGPGTNGSQFFVLDGPAPHLNHRHTVFGICSPSSIVNHIARVPQTGRAGGNRPLTDVLIRRVRIERGEG